MTTIIYKDKLFNLIIKTLFTKSTYDASNYLSQIITSNWDNQSNQCKESNKNEFSVNWAGNVLEEIFYLYDDGNSQWEGTYKYNYTYNISYTINNLIIPPLQYFWPDYYELINNMPPEGMNYDYDGSWKMNARIRYQYSEHDVGIAESSSDENIRIFPNPASGFTNIKLNNSIKQALFTLNDIRGKVVLQKIVNDDEKINLTPLTNGFYFYSITKNRKVIGTGKLSVHK